MFKLLFWLPPRDSNPVRAKKHYELFEVAAFVLAPCFPNAFPWIHHCCSAKALGIVTVRSYSRPRVRAGQRSKEGIPARQEALYQSLLDKIHNWQPEAVLEYFKQLFIEQSGSAREVGMQAVFYIADANDPEIFQNTFRRCCYILINNWESSRNSSYVRDLIQIIPDPVLRRHTTSPLIQRIRSWVLDFIESDAFADLKLFASRFEERQQHWTQRYSYYFLVSQSVDQQNPLEQRTAARTLSKSLRKRFATNLAHYLAHSQLSNTSLRINSTSQGQDGRSLLPQNPTGLGDEAIRLIKSIVIRKGQFSYENLANIFHEQVKGLAYRGYKSGLFKYLVFSIDDRTISGSFHKTLSEKLLSLYTDKDVTGVDAGLQLRTCNQIIRFLTIEDENYPSNLFLNLLASGASLTLSILLLKILLICPNARSFLDLQIAKLVQNYQGQRDEECAWFINFLDVLSVTLAIYMDGTSYSLVRAPERGTGAANSAQQNLDQYQLFSQRRLVSRIQKAMNIRAAQGGLELPDEDGNDSVPE